MPGWDLFGTKPEGLNTAGKIVPSSIKHLKGGVTHSRFAGLYQNFKINFKSMVSGIAAEFPAILTSFSDSWTSNWDSQDIYGRMDQIHNFKNTTRVISFAFAVVPDDALQSAELMGQFESLVRMLYPRYETAPDESATDYQAMNVNLLRAAPIIGIKMGNLIRSNDSNNFLLGKVAGFNFNPDVDAGFWLSPGPSTFEGGDTSMTPASVEGSQYYPKKWEVQVEFTVMHTEPLAQGGGDWQGNNEYPYNSAAMVDSLPDSEKMDVYIEEQASFIQAKIPKKKKKSLTDKLLDAMFKP